MPVFIFTYWKPIVVVLGVVLLIGVSFYEGDQYASKKCALAADNTTIKDQNIVISDMKSTASDNNKVESVYDKKIKAIADSYSANPFSVRPSIGIDSLPTVPHAASGVNAATCNYAQLNAIIAKRGAQITSLQQWINDEAAIYNK